MRDEFKEIRKIRVQNNDLWMEILDIALRHAPTETKKVLKSIRANDLLVTQHLGDIVYED
jgi:hypothetical protein